MPDVYSVMGPLLRRFDPERAHRFALMGLRSGLGKFAFPPLPETASLAVSLWDLSFPNPIGLAAGFDKNAEVFEKALDLGFGFVEVGGVTPKPQMGNPPPRLFRLDEDKAVINRMGFNNEGMEAIAERLSRRCKERGIVGVNLGKNKETQNAPDDYAVLAERLSPYTDFLVINVSSPNTPGLRALQSVGPLVEIISATRSARDKVASGYAPRILLKIAPDLESSEVNDITGIAEEEKLDGLIVSNTTLARPPSLRSSFKGESGGLSGAPLFEPSTKMLRTVYERTQGRLPLIGVGGISSGKDAYAKIRAGASLVQLYSALVFEGPGLLNRIKTELISCLEKDGFASVAEAVGADHRSSAVSGSM